MIHSYHEAAFGEMEDLLRAYAGMPADDTEDKPSAALEAWLRHTHRIRPQAIAGAARQIRDLLAATHADLEPDEEERRNQLPDLGHASEAELNSWLAVVARHLEQVSDDPSWSPDLCPPTTHWEWRARFPQLAQLLGGWFSQDAPDEFPDHSTALADYTATTHPDLVARLTGELHELLALGLGEAQLAVAIAELGQEVEPPSALSPGGWLAWLAEGFRAAATARARQAPGQ